MSSLPSKMKKIQSEMKTLEWPQHISHCKFMGIFPDTQGQLNSAVCCRIWSKFELCLDFMVVLVTCKNDEELIKNEGSRVDTRLYVDCSDIQGQITP